MDTDLLQKALQKCKENKDANTRAEMARQQEIFAAIPEIEALYHQRRDNILSIVARSFEGIVPPNLADITDTLSAQIRRLLRENHYPEDYLAPLVTCPHCKDTGLIGDIKKQYCSCVLREVQRLSTQKYALPQTDASFEKFDESLFSATPLEDAPGTQRGRMRQIKAYCQTYVSRLPDHDPKNLLFYGKSGLGKTYLMHCMAKEAVSRGISSLIISAHQLGQQFRQAFFDNAVDTLSSLYQVDFLLIDDLGTEPMLQNITIEQLFALLDTRLNTNKCTLISTNFSLNELEARYTERIASRLFDITSYGRIQFLGSDIRKNKR